MVRWEKQHRRGRRGGAHHEKAAIQFSGDPDLFPAVPGCPAAGLAHRSEWTTLHAFCVYRSSLADPLFYVRLFGHVLGHADFDHFLGNMLLLLVIGPPLEEKYGSRTLLAGILLTAGVSGILQCVFFPGSALLGASGIVFMLIMLASLAGMKDGRIPLTLILAAVLYLGQEVYAMVALRDNVANFMHLVGGVTGTVFGVVLAKRR